MTSSSLTTVQPVVDATTIVDRFRCGQSFEFGLNTTSKTSKGFFRFGPGVIGYGRIGTVNSSAEERSKLFDASQHVQHIDKTILLPFDIDEVVDNLRYERYVQQSGWQARIQQSWLGDAYYFLRPLLPVSVRKHLQRAYLHDWSAISFPTWPLDRSVDLLLERLLAVAMQASGIDRIPFIWFWPAGCSACAIMTHDVETTAGRDFSYELMDIDDAFGVKASFQIVPEKRYEVPPEYLETLRSRGFEINVQGLDHHGDLFRDRETFLRKAEKINEYARQYRAVGFRSPVLYRNTDWFKDMNFSYDMSVPNVARLEAQRGGCCTLMPYFLPGGVTELPLTTAEDYTLFHVLNDYSTDLWRQQIDIIHQSHGLMTFIVHPDYIVTRRAQDVFKGLLAQIAELRTKKGVWVTLPRDVDQWWRQRSEMSLLREDGRWKIAGPGSDRACVAYACLDGDKLVFEIENQSVR